MARLFVRHAVADYQRWREGYDEANSFREQNGVTATGVYVSVDDGSDVTVHHDFDSVEAALAYVAHPELRTRMERLGVLGTPEMWVTTERG